MSRQYGNFARHEGLLSEMSEDLLEEMKEMIKETLQEGIEKDGLNPEDFTYDAVVRQQYNNKSKTEVWDEPIFEENIPFVTIAIKATAKESEGTA